MNAATVVFWRHYERALSPEGITENKNPVVADQTRRPDFAHRVVKSIVGTTEFLAIALARERRFEAALLAGRDEEGVAFHFADDILLLHFAFEAAQSALE
jgi:hypothetical protein